MRWLACGLLLVMGVCAPAVAEPETVPLPHGGVPIEVESVAVTAHITMIQAGWNAESFAIKTVEQISNPARCPTATADRYVADGTQRGYHTYYAAALLAFAERATVIVAVTPLECSVSNRPKLIGINILR